MNEWRMVIPDRYLEKSEGLKQSPKSTYIVFCTKSSLSKGQYLPFSLFLHCFLLMHAVSIRVGFDGLRI